MNDDEKKKNVAFCQFRPEFVFLPLRRFVLLSFCTAKKQLLLRNLNRYKILGESQNLGLKSKNVKT